jgi:hypothetical protein
MSPGADIDEAAWYQVSRVGDAQGNASRTLFFGSLAGDLRGVLELGAYSADEGDSARDAYDVVDPQAAGVFAGRALVWGREGQSNQIESVDLGTGAIEPITSAAGTVHTATADLGLRRVFFITVAEGSQLPNALWVSDAGSSEPTELPYTFTGSPDPYRIAASPDGGLVAIQPGVDGPVTVIAADGEQALRAEPGGSLLGLTNSEMVAFGPASDTGARSIVAVPFTTFEMATLAEDMQSAQIVPGSDGDWVAAMRTSELDAGYEIFAISLTTGESTAVYRHEGDEVGPLLATLDRAYFGYTLPPAWVLLIDSFTPFIDDPAVPDMDPPTSSHPLALHLPGGETVQLGTFSAD